MLKEDRMSRDKQEKLQPKWKIQAYYEKNSKTKYQF